MPVTRERVDPVRDQSELGLVHRRWILPDDVQRPVVLPQLVRLWRGLLDDRRRSRKIGRPLPQRFPRRRAEMR